MSGLALMMPWLCIQMSWPTAGLKITDCIPACLHVDLLDLQHKSVCCAHKSP